MFAVAQGRGFPCSSSANKMQSSEDDFDPSQNATAKLMQHISEKGFQTGSVLGVVFRLPLLFYRQRSTGVTAHAALAAVSRTALITTACTGVCVCGISPIICSESLRSSVTIVCILSNAFPCCVHRFRGVARQHSARHPSWITVLQEPLGWP